MEPGRPVDQKKIVFAAAGALLCVLFSFVLDAPASLESAAAAAGSSGPVAMRILGITLLAILWWVGNVVPDWLTTLAMLILWVVLAKVPFAAAFGAFSGHPVWLIIGALCLAVGVTKTGFFKRISWFLLRVAPPTFNGQLAAMLLVGTVCSPLVPSATAKAVLGVSIAANIATAMGYGAESRGRCGLFVAAWLGFGASAPAFLTGSIFSYALYGALPEKTRAAITWTNWFVAMIPWLVVFLIGCFFALKWLYQPKEGSAMTKEHAREEYRKLGPMSKKETISAAVLAFAVAMWVLESFTGVNASITALVAAFLCFATGILDKKEISSAVPWGQVIFLGGVLSMGNVFSDAGINRWLQTLLTPLFAQCGSGLVVVLVVTAMVLLVRFVIASQSAAIIIMLAILAPVTETLGISLFIVGILVYAAGQCWFIPYQNVVFAPALACMNGTVSHNSTVKGCVAYEVVSLLGGLASIPYWALLGYM